MKQRGPHRLGFYWPSLGLPPSLEIDPAEYEFVSNKHLAKELRYHRRVQLAEARALAAHDHLQALALQFREAIDADRQCSAELEEVYLQGTLSAIDRREYTKRRKELDRITKQLAREKNELLLARVRNTRSRNRWPR